MLGGTGAGPERLLESYPRGYGELAVGGFGAGQLPVCVQQALRKPDLGKPQFRGLMKRPIRQGPKCPLFGGFTFTHRCLRPAGYSILP